MPAAAKPDPKATYRPWDGFVRVVDGRQYVVTSRNRFAGDHPLVQDVPAMFVRADAPDSEVAAARSAVLAEASKRHEAAERERARADRSRLRKLLDAAGDGISARSREADARRAEEARAEAADQSALAERNRRERAERLERQREIAALAARRDAR